jgi:hypothetical protein
MLTHTRRALTALAGAAALTIGVLAVAGPATAAPAGHSAGTVGSSITLSTARAYSGYDVATNAAGTAYIGWIADTATTSRAVHLCTLPVNATKCSGGEQVITTPGYTSANGLRVLATRGGQVTLVWIHDDDTTGTGPEKSKIAIATASQGLHLSAAHDVSSAPSRGELYDAEIAPNGGIWTLTNTGVTDKTIQVREGLTATTYTTMHTPYGIGYAQLAFAGKTGVVAIEKAGAISTPVAFATVAGTHTTVFKSVAHTWAVGHNAGLVASGRGVRLVTATSDASYRAVISRWTGSSFTKPILTADHNACVPSSHDVYADGSGRFVDASWECNKVAIASYTDDLHAAIIRFNTPGTPTYTPQIATGSRGIATVAWSNESKAGGSTLHVTRVRLPDTTRKTHGKAKGGRITVTGPVNCLGAVGVTVGVTGYPKHGWHIASRRLTLGSSVVSGKSIDGATLAAGKNYTLHGTVVFAKHTARSTARADLAFRTCA